VDGTNGVKNFDVWTFYAEHPEAPFPHRRRGRRDFGPSHFGRYPADREFAGRALDFLARSVWYPVGADPVAAVQNYLSEDQSDSARRLAQKSCSGSGAGATAWSRDLAYGCRCACSLTRFSGGYSGA